MKKKITKNNSSLKTFARLLLVALLVVTQVASVTTMVWAEDKIVLAADVPSTSKVTINGVTYNTLTKNGQVQLIAGDKVKWLSDENVMAAAYLDSNGTVWTINYRGICAGYNYMLQKDEPSVNLHK